MGCEEAFRAFESVIVEEIDGAAAMATDMRGVAESLFGPLTEEEMDRTISMMRQNNERVLQMWRNRREQFLGECRRSADLLTLDADVPRNAAECGGAIAAGLKFVVELIPLSLFDPGIRNWLSSEVGVGPGSGRIRDMFDLCAEAQGVSEEDKRSVSRKAREVAGRLREEFFPGRGRGA